MVFNLLFVLVPLSLIRLVILKTALLSRVFHLVAYGLPFLLINFLISSILICCRILQILLVKINVLHWGLFDIYAFSVLGFRRILLTVNFLRQFIPEVLDDRFWALPLGYLPRLLRQLMLRLRLLHDFPIFLNLFLICKLIGMHSLNSVKNQPIELLSWHFYFGGVVLLDLIPIGLHKLLCIEGVKCSLRVQWRIVDRSFATSEAQSSLLFVFELRLIA